MNSNSSYASYLDTATDLAGQSWAVWAENGLLYAARWDEQGQRWADAAAISNATGGRNVTLTVGQVVRRNEVGQDMPALVVTWESGPDNDADLYGAVGFHGPDGSLLWSDAMNLLPGGVAETNHSVGISGNRLVVATEAQAVVNPVSSSPTDAKPSSYHDSDINTYSIAIQSRSSNGATGDPSFRQGFAGGNFQGQLKTLMGATGISGGSLIGATVNGIPIAIGATEPTTIKGLGSFSLSSNGELSFSRGDNPPSELQIGGELIGNSADGGRAYARTSALLRPTELSNSQQSSYGNEGYTLSVSTLNGAGEIKATTILPLSFNASERLERVTAATFTPPKPLSGGNALRNFTGSGRFTDTSLARALDAANGQTSLERTALGGGALPSNFKDWGIQVFGDPYQLSKGLPSRWNISFGDLMSAFTGTGSKGIPLLDFKRSGFDLGLDGLILYNSSGDLGNQKLNVEAGLNLRLGRTVAAGDDGVSKGYKALSMNNPKEVAKLNKPGGWFKKAGENWINGKSKLANWAYGETTTKQTKDKKITSNKKNISYMLEEIEGNPRGSSQSENSNFKIKFELTEDNQSKQLYQDRGSGSKSMLDDINELNQQAFDNPPANYSNKTKSGNQSSSSLSTQPKNRISSINGIRVGDFEAYLRQQFFNDAKNASFRSELSGARAGEIRAGYLFNVFPLRAVELLFAARETYSYSTSQSLGLQDPALTAKRLQFGIGADFGLVGNISLGFGSPSPDGAKVNRFNNGNIPSISILDVQAEVGAKVAVNVGLSYSEPLPTNNLKASLLWKEKNYERAYLPFFEDLPTEGQWAFRGFYYLSQGIQLARPFTAPLNGKFKSKPNTSRTSEEVDTGKDPQKSFQNRSRINQLIGLGEGGARIVSQVPFLYTAGDIIFGNLSSGSYAKGGFDNITISVSAYANGSISLFNGAVGGYTRNSAGINAVIPKGIGWQYNTELGYTVGGISKSLWNLRDSGTLAGDTSGFIANTFLESSPALSLSVYRHAPSAANGLGERISAAPAAAPAIAGALNLTGLLQNSSVTDAAATGDLVVSVYAVVLAPSDVAVNGDGSIAGLKLLVEGAAIPLRVSLDQRALRNGAERLGLSQPWQELFNQWATPTAASSAALSGIKPGQALPIQVDLLVPKGTDPATIGKIGLAYQLGNAAPQSFGSANAPLLAWMPSSPMQRQEQGSAYQLGLTGSGTIGATTSRVAPYISAFLVNAPGSNLSDTDFVIEEGSAVVRGRLIAGVTGGQGITGVDVYDTASAEAFAGDSYRSLEISQLKARVATGSDAQILLQASNGALTGVALAKNGAGSGYLNGGSGRFRQWVSGTPSEASTPARALLDITVSNGSVSAVGIVAQEGRFADGQLASLTLANSVAGNGSGLDLIPLIRTSLDTNLLDESGVSIGSFQRYVDGGFRSEVDLVYTQGGADRSKAINSGLNLDTPLLVNRISQDGRGWVNIAFQDPAGAYTPGVDGFNFDSASNSLYFNNDTIGGKRSVVLFSHANLSAIQSERDLYLLEDALVEAQVYAALERKDQANNLFFSSPVLLSDPSRGGTNSNGKIEPFYAVEGAGIAPIFDANRQLLATWVHTTPAGQAEIQVRIGTATGDPASGSINWSPIRSIALPEKVSGNDVTDLSLTYLNGTTPVLSWSLNSLTPYQAGVLRSKPTAYYRLDDLPSQGTLASIGESTLAGGQLATGAEMWRYSSWLDTSANPLGKDDVFSALGALTPAERTAQQPGDPNASLGFSGGGFAEVPNVFLSRLSGASNEQPSGYAADFWVKPEAPAAGAADAVESLLDNGLYNPGAVLPGAAELKLPVQLRRTATTQTVDGVERNGYLYSLVVAASTFANLGTEGLGSGLSPFNLSFAIPETSLTFTSATAGSKTISLPGTPLGDLVQYRTKQGKLNSFTLGEEEVEVTSFFEADVSSPGLQKQVDQITYTSQDVGIESRQNAGWSVRKRLTNGQQFVDFNFGTDATLSAALPSNSDGWNHIAVSYGEDISLNTKVARLFLNGQLAAESIEDPENLKGYDFNLLPYQLGYQFKGSIDELVLNEQPITSFNDWTTGRLATRFVNPKSATQATFFTEASYDGKTQAWNWNPAQPFHKSDYIPSTIPGFFRSGPVDMATAGTTGELRGDGKADLRALLPLQGIKVGSLITGIRARINGEDYAVGDGLRFGMDGKPNTQAVKGLMGVTASGAKLNAGEFGKDLEFALMGSQADLSLFLPLDPSLAGKAVDVVAFVRTPRNRAEGGDRFNLWPFASTTAGATAVTPTFQATLESSSTAAVLSPFHTNHVVEAAVLRPEPSSLLDINTGFNTNLALTNENTLADPANQRFAEAIAAGSLGKIPFVAIANPGLDGIAGIGNQRGVVWVLRYDISNPDTVAKLQGLQSLVSAPEGKFDSAQLDGLVIVGRDGQQIGRSVIWADLDGDGEDELILASPTSPSSNGDGNSGQVVVISGAYLKGVSKSGSKKIDLAEIDQDSSKVRVFAGADGAEFGTALAFGKVSVNGNALLIGAPGYQAKVSTDAFGQSIAADQRKTTAVGAVFMLDADPSLFKQDSTATPALLLSGDLPGLANFNAGVEPTARRFGAAISITSPERSFTGEKIAGKNFADIVIGIPGLMQSRRLKGGINAKATAAQRDAELQLRVNVPDVYREGMDDSQLSDPVEKQMGGVLLIQGGKTADQAKKVLLLGDTVFGDAAGAGSAVATGGNFGGKAADIDDLAIGMPEVDAKTGAVSLISGDKIRGWFSQATADNFTNASMQRSAVVDAALIIPGDEANGSYGRTLNLSSDVNGDSKADLVIGDSTFMGGTGRVNVLFGSSTFGGTEKGQISAGTTFYHNLKALNPQRRLDIYPGSFGEGLGNSVALLTGSKKASDLLLPTSNGSSNLTTLLGKSRLDGLGSFSSRDLASSDGIEIDDLQRRTNGSASYGLLGDVNGDGIADALVDVDHTPGKPSFKLSFGMGAGLSPDHQDGGTGGSSVLDLKPVLSLQHQGATNLSLQNVRSAGDLNADGINDLLLSYSYDSNGRSIPTNAILLGGDLLTSNVLMQSALVSQIAPAPSVAAGSVLRSGDLLAPNEYLLSPNGRFMALMQADGDFVMQTLKSDGVNWDVSFTLRGYLEARLSSGSFPITTFGAPIANTEDSSVKLGSTPGTSLEIRNGTLAFVNDRFRAGDGSKAIALTSGVVTSNGVSTTVTTESLPANAVFQDLSLTDSGVLVAKASDGTTLFSFDPSYSQANNQAAIPEAKLSGLTLKVALDQAPRAIGTAAVGSNDGAPTLLAISEAAGTAALRTVVARARLIDVGQLFNQWLAGFTPPGNDEIELKAALDEFSTGLKNELTPFDPLARDAALVSKANLEVVAGVLEDLVPNAGASFLNFVESKAPGYEQQPVNLVASFGDAPTSAVVAGLLANGQAAHLLLPGQRLKPGDYLLSANGRFMALMQADGNFVVQTLNADGVRWDVSFSLNDYVDMQYKKPVANAADASVVLGSTAGTSLEIRNGVLSFVNDRFLTADGSNTIALTSGFYVRGGTARDVTTRALPANASFQQLSLNDNGVLEAKASDGTTLFSFERFYSNSIIQTPIPAEKLSGLQRPSYEPLNLSNRQLILSDRDGDGSKELVIAPTKSSSDQALYSVELLDTPADPSAPWVVTRLATAPAASNSHLLWESRPGGVQPGNALTGEKAGDAQLRKINGFAQDFISSGSSVLLFPGNAEESGGAYGVNGASLSRTMLHLHTPNKKGTWGEYSRRIGGLDLNQRLQQQGESWELKVPAYVWQMKSKRDGTPANQGADELVLHIGSGIGSSERMGNTDTSQIGLDGLAINFDEYDSSLRLFWDGKLIWQAGPKSTASDLDKLRSSNGKTLSEADLKAFMLPDGGLHDGAGINTGPELMSNLGNWFNNLFSSGFYLRYQKADKPLVDKNGKILQGHLIMEVANAMRYLPYEDKTFGDTPRLNAINKGLQIAIPIEQPLSLSGSDVVLNAYARSGGWPGVHALAGIEFNTDKPLEGVNLDRLISAGDLNGDGYEDLVGIGTLATGWNYDYKLDLPHNNLSERGSSSDTSGETSFTLNKGANGEGITRSTLITPVILWGGSGEINLDQLTPIVRGSDALYTHTSIGGLAALDNFSSANNVMLAPMGDLNGDGFDDIAISDVELGLTYVLHGGTGLQSAKSYLNRFGAFFPETRAKDSPKASADIYLTSDAKGFGTPADSSAPTAWFAGINLERASKDQTAARPAFGGVQVTKISGITGQQLANLSGGSDISGDGINDLFLTSQSQYNATKDLSHQDPSRFVIFGGDNTRSFTHAGTNNSDSIKGTPTNDVIVTMGGNDIVQSQGGMDAISTGPGDDQIVLANDQFRRIDGGSDVDTLILQGQRNQAWDFTKLASAGRIRNIEQIVATDFGANQLTLNARAAAAITSGGGTLIFDGDLQTEKPAVVLVRAINTRLQALDPVSAEYDALLDVATRYSGFSFGLSDLSMLPVVVRDVQRDLVFDSLRALTNQIEKRPLTDLLDRLNAIDTDRKLGLGLDFLTVFAQRLAFSPVSALEAYEAWLADLPKAVPDAYVLLSAQQKTDLAALPQAWRSTYAPFFPANGETIPAVLAFERFLNSGANPAATAAEAFTTWLANGSASIYNLPASNDSRQVQLVRLLNSLDALTPALVKEVMSSFDSVRLSTEFSLANADLPAGSEAFSEYVAAGGSVRLLIPEWMAVVIDPTVPTELIPTPATTSSSSTTTGANTNLEAPLASTSAPSTEARTSTRADLRISVGESRPSSDGRALEFTLTRSGHLSETSRVQVNTEGYVADLVSSMQGQVVFAPGVVSQKVLIPLMANLPQEQQALDPYAVESLRNVSVRLNLLPESSSGPRSTSVVGLNAINAFTPELLNPSRPLTAAQLNPAPLFERNVALQFPTALWLTAIANGPEEPIQFGFDNPQGQQLNDVRLVDRISGDLVSIFDAANLGTAVIYGESDKSPSTDLFFSVEDGGQFDQDGLTNSQITLAAAGALASPGSLLVGDRVLRAPSTSGMHLLLTPPVGGFRGALAAYTELLLIPADEISGAVKAADGIQASATTGDAYLQALINRMADAPDGVRRIALNRGSAITSLQLANDTNYVAVLSKASADVLPTVADLRLPTLRNTSGTNSRSIGNYQLQLDNQRLSFQLSSPYYIVPGVEGKTIALTTQFRAPSGSPVSSYHMAWLRVKEVNGDLMPLLASNDLSDRLITVPTDGVVELMGGDILIPLIFQGIDPSRWAALPAGERLLQGQQASGTWRVDIPDPSINPQPLLQRTQANAYQFGIDGNLVVRYGAELQASLIAGERVIGTTGNDQFRDPNNSLGLTFVQNIIISGAGNDEVAARNAAASTDNVVLAGAGDDLITPSFRDIVYAGTGVDGITLNAAGGNRVDSGTGNDTFQINTGGQRLLGGAGEDIFKISGTITSPVVIAGGSDADQFWLADDQGNLTGATVVISDFDGENGDRLILPDYTFSDLIFQQSGANVAINIGNTEVALLMNRSLDLVAEASFFRFDSSDSADRKLTEFGDTPDPLATIYGDGNPSVAEVISDGVNGLSALAKRTFGNTNPEIAVYIHTNSGKASVGGGRTGRKTINAIAVNDADAEWMREQIRLLDSVLGINFRFVSSSTESNLDIYYDESISLSSDRTTLGIALANDNGRQSWWELMLNASALAGNPSGFRYTFLHELGHVLGLEHPFDNSDGDAEGQRFGQPDAATTMMSYTRPQEGWPGSYQMLDWAALATVWGLDQTNNSGWRFSNSSAGEEVVDTNQALDRLIAARPGDQFMGRADGLTSENSSPTPAITPQPDPAPQPQVQPITIDKSVDPTAASTSTLPVLVVSEPQSTSLNNGEITWQPFWRQLDLELGAVLDADNQLQVLSAAGYGSTPRNGHQLVDLIVNGSTQADVVFASSGNTVDLGLGQDVIFSLSNTGGNNRLYGGAQADRFVLGAQGDLVYGGMRMAGTQESITDGNNNIFAIDLDARDSAMLNNPAIEIRDFQLGLDSLTLIEGDPSLSTPLPISPATYFEWRNKLQEDYNVVLNAAPQVRQAKRNLAITSAMLDTGFSISARDLFSDLDAGELTLVGLDKNPSWLQLVNGKLRVELGADVQSGTYAFAVAGSDGISRTPLTSFSFAVDPKVSIGSLNLAAGSALQFRFNGIGNAAVELLVQTLDANDQPLHSPRLVAGQMGRNGGLPAGIDGNLSNAVAGDQFNSGRVAFFLRKPMESAELIPLEIKDINESSFLLSSGSISVDAAVVATPAATPLTTFLEVGGESMLGLALPSLSPSSDDLTRKVSVSIDLFREAAFNSTIGFYLADAITGAVVHASTGTFITGTPFDDQGNLSANYASTASANSIWKGTVGDGGTTTISQVFDVHASLNLDGMALLPFMEVDTGDKRHTFIAGSSGNSDRISHITMLSNNVFGFEDQLSGGDFDFDDMVAVIRSVNMNML